MKGRALIGAIMEARGLSNAEMARRLDLSTAAMWDRANNTKSKDVYSSVLAETLEAMGYKLVAVPEDTPLPEDAYFVS